MKILYFLGSWPKLSESFILNEIRYLGEQGHDISIFALKDPEEDVTHPEVDKVRAEVGYSRDYGSRSYLFSIGNLIDPVILRSLLGKKTFRYAMYPKELAHSFLLFRDLLKFIKNMDEKPDIMHLHFLDVKVIAASRISSLFDIPISCTAHAVDIFKNPDFNYLQKLLNELDILVVPSRYNKRWVEDNFDKLPPIKYVPASNDLSKFKTSRDTKENRILTVGRLVKKKGIEYGIKALKDIKEDFEYHIVGSGPEEENLKKLVKDLGLDDKVKFLGNVSDERLMEEYDEASIFLLPCIITDSGDRDSMPVVLKEAMAMETACISTNIVAIPEIIDDGENGIIVESRDAEGLKEAILTLLNDKNKRRSLAKKGREKALTNFSRDVVGKKLESKFKELEGSY